MTFRWPKRTARAATKPDVNLCLGRSSCRKSRCSWREKGVRTGEKRREGKRIEANWRGESLQRRRRRRETQGGTLLNIWLVRKRRKQGSPRQRLFSFCFFFNFICTERSRNRWNLVAHVERLLRHVAFICPVSRFFIFSLFNSVPEIVFRYTRSTRVSTNIPATRLPFIHPYSPPSLYLGVAKRRCGFGSRLTCSNYVYSK